jgi:hypothetical protein
MTFRKATVLFSLFVVYFALAAQTAKADTITFTDLTDSPTLSGSTRLALMSCSLTSLAETCTAVLQPPLFTLNAAIIDYRLGEGSLTGRVSDAFHAVVTPLAALLTFTSDLPNALGEANGLGTCVSMGGCNAVENGMPQLVGTIVWTNPITHASVTDSIFLQSDVVPEPASLILFGSGLAIVGGFLRRRRHLVTPAV